MLIQYEIALLTTAITLFLLAVFVYFKDRKNKINRTYTFFVLSAFLWSFGEARLIIAQTEQAAYFWNYICNLGIFFIGTGYVHFVLTFLGIDNQRTQKSVIKISYAYSFLAALLLNTKIFLPPPVPKFSLNYFIEPGPVIYFVFVLLWFCQVTYGLFQLFKSYVSSSGLRRNQLKYLLIGTLIGFVGGSGNYFLTFNIELFPINPFGTYGVVVFSAMMTYAIIRYRLMDITVLAVRTFIFMLVYFLVLGIPFWIGFRYIGGRIWILPVTVMAILASIGPFIYSYFRRQAEEVLLRDQRRYQRALTELSKTMGRIRDLNELVKAITKTVVDTVKVSFAGIYLKSDEYKSYQLKDIYPASDKSHFQEFIPLDYSLIRLLSVRKRPLLSEEAGSFDKINLDGGVVIPFFIEDELLGFLVIGSKPNSQMYTPDDLLIFEALSYSSALAIENSYFWKEIEDRQRKARLQEMDTYSYSLAHEIDNPIQVILGYIEYLKKYFLEEIDLPPEKRKDLEGVFNLMEEAATRISGMVKAIRDFGQKTTGEQTPINIEEVVDSFCRLYFPQFKANSVFFEKHSELKKPVFVLAEKPQLMQVVFILANNSIHAMKYSKEKKISLKEELSTPDHLKISFSDTGYGIKKELLSIIFEPFTTTKASTEGTGMGLNNAKKIIEKHKGKIWAESEGEGKGATFFIELPVTKDTKPKKDIGDKQLF